MVNQVEVWYDCTLNGCEATMTVYRDRDNDGNPDNQETFRLKDGEHTLQTYQIDWRSGDKYSVKVEFETDDITKAPVLHGVEVRRGITVDTRGIEIRTDATLNDGEIDLEVFEYSYTYDRVRNETISLREGEIATYLYYYDVEPSNEYWVKPKISVPGVNSVPPELHDARIIPYPDIGFVEAERTIASGEALLGSAGGKNVTQGFGLDQVADSNKITSVAEVTTQSARGRVVGKGQGSIEDITASPLTVDPFTEFTAPCDITPSTTSPLSGFLKAFGDVVIGNAETFDASLTGIGVRTDTHSSTAAPLEATGENQIVRPGDIVAKKSVATPTEAFPSKIAFRGDVRTVNAIPFRGSPSTFTDVTVDTTPAVSTRLVGGIDIELDKQDAVGTPLTPGIELEIPIDATQGDGEAIQGVGTNVLYNNIQGLKENAVGTGLVGGPQNVQSVADITTSTVTPFEGALTSSVQADIYDATLATATPLRNEKARLTEISGTGIEITPEIGQTSESQITEAQTYTTITGKKTSASAIPLMTIIRAFGGGFRTEANASAIPMKVGHLQDVESTTLTADGDTVRVAPVRITSASTNTTVGAEPVRTAEVNDTEAFANVHIAKRRTGFPTLGQTDYLTAGTKFRGLITQATANTGSAMSPSESSRVEATATPLSPDVHTQTSSSSVGGGSEGGEGGGVTVVSANGSTTEAFRFLSGKVTEATSPNQFTAQVIRVTANNGAQAASGSGVVPRGCTIDMARLPDEDRTEVIADNPPIPPQGRDTVTKAESPEQFTMSPRFVTVNTKGPHRVSSLDGDKTGSYPSAPEYEGECVKCKIYEGYDENDDYYYYTDLVYCGTDESVKHPDIGCGPLDDGESGHLKEGSVNFVCHGNPLTARMSEVTDAVDVTKANASSIDVEGEIGRVYGPVANGQPIQARGETFKIPVPLKQNISASPLEPAIDMETADSITEANASTGVIGTDLPFTLEPPMQGARATPLLAGPRDTARRTKAEADFPVKYRSSLEPDTDREIEYKYDNWSVSTTFGFTETIAEVSGRGIEDVGITEANASSVDAEDVLNWRIDGVEFDTVESHEVTHDMFKIKIVCSEEQASKIRPIRRNAGAVQKVILDDGSFYSWSGNNTRWVRVQPPYRMRPLRQPGRYLVDDYDEKIINQTSDAREIELKLTPERNREFRPSTENHETTPITDEWEFRFNDFNVATRHVSGEMSRKGYDAILELLLTNEQAWILETNLSTIDAVQVVEGTDTKATVFDNNGNKRNSVIINVPDNAESPLTQPNNNYVVTDWKTRYVTDNVYKVTLKVQEPTIPPIAYGDVQDGETEVLEPDVLINVTANVEAKQAVADPKRNTKTSPISVDASPISVAPHIVVPGSITSASTASKEGWASVITPAFTRQLDARGSAITAVSSKQSASPSPLVGEPKTSYAVTMESDTDTASGEVEIVEWNRSVENFYNYDGASANTAEILQYTDNNIASIMLYRNTVTNAVSLVVIYGYPKDGEGGGSAGMSFARLPSQSSVLVKDDEGDTYNVNAPTGSISHNWGGNGTDGVAIGTWDITDEINFDIEVDSFTNVDVIRTIGQEGTLVEMEMDDSITINIQM